MLLAESGRRLYSSSSNSIGRRGTVQDVRSWEVGYGVGSVWCRGGAWERGRGGLVCGRGKA
eukprot:1478734-Rhodomonas_salina.2